jgi:MFS family permease
MKNIRWKSTIALLMLNCVVVLSWLAYTTYQPILLSAINVTHLQGFLYKTQFFAMLLLPPIAGGLGDYILKKKQNFFFLLLISISITSLIFMIVASMISNTHIQLIVDYIPLFIVLWIVSMNIFHSPANSLLEKLVNMDKFPFVMALIVASTDIVMGIEPLIVSFIKWIGPVATFSGGGFALLATGLYFIQTNKKEPLITEHKSIVNENQTFNPFIIFLVGLIVGGGNAFLLNKFQLSTVTLLENQIYVSTLLIASGLLGVFAALKLSSTFLFKTLVYGVLITLSAILIYTITTENTIINSLLWIFLVVGIGISNYAALPIALKYSTPERLTLSIGLFYSGFECIDQLMNLLQM